MPIDPSAVVARTAVIHPEAIIGAGTRIGEYCVVEQDVVIGENCLFEPYVLVKRWTTMGDNNQVSAGAALGTDSLDKGFTGERSYLTIGSNNKIREHFTISRGTNPESETRIGDGNYIMTSGHIAHNCRLGNNIVVASCALLAGYVEVDDQAFISGHVAVQQFTNIGRLAMVSGLARVNSDLPPFFLYAGFNVVAIGLNVIGLRRAGFSREQRQQLKAAYKLLYRGGLSLTDAVRRIQMELPGPDAQQLLEFLGRSKRGIAREAPGVEADQMEDEDDEQNSR